MVNEFMEGLNPQEKETEREKGGQQEKPALSFHIRENGKSAR